MTTDADKGDTSLSPDEAFGLLGNDTRVGIMRALWDAFESGTNDNELTYSELFERVDYDDSGNFSYHLEKLTGPFIRQTDLGYELKQTGINVVRAVLAGTMIDDPVLGPTAVDATCPLCDAPIEISTTAETYHVRRVSTAPLKHFSVCEF
jgi:DNA-binding transcriptional ArsR family regulator